MYYIDLKFIFFNVKREFIVEDFMKVEDLWIKEVQRNMQEEFKVGKYKCLCFCLCKDGIYVVGGCVISWMEMSYNKSEVILLFYEYCFLCFYVEYVYNRGYYGVLIIVSKICFKFWIIKLFKMMKLIKYNCVICRKFDKKLSE